MIDVTQQVLGPARTWDDVEIMQRVAERAATDSSLIGSAFSTYKQAHGMSDDELVEQLGVTKLQLYRLASLAIPKYGYGMLIIERTWGGDAKRLAEIVWGESQPKFWSPPPEHGGKE